MAVVYLDSVFLLNSIMDYLILLTTATLAGIPLRRKRYALAALLGGVYAVSIFLPGLVALGTLPIKVAAGIILGLIAFGNEERLFRLLLLTLAVACTIAGCVLGFGLLSKSRIPIVNGIFYTDVDASVLLLTASGAWMVIRLLFQASGHQYIEKRLLTVVLSIGNRRQVLTALWDSGNGLRNPIDGTPVLVVAQGGVDDLLPNEAACLLTSEALRSPGELVTRLREVQPKLRPYLLPYNAVGGGGLLLAIHCDWAEIGGRKYPGLTVALSPNSLGDGYSALWCGDGRKEGKYETMVEASEGLAGKTASS